MFWDWYAATISADSPQVVADLVRTLGAEPRAGKALNGYASAVELVRATEVVGRVLFGGNGGRPHVFASSSNAPRMAAALRGLYPGAHVVTRADAAQDFDGPGTWDRLSKLLLDLAVEKDLAIDQNGDWFRAERGRTLYVGSKKSAVFLRLYEKGKQQRDLAAPGWEDLSMDLCRVELVVRPEGDARAFAARCEPIDVYGFAVWAQEAAQRVFGADVQRVSIKAVRDSDDERALRAVVNQYAGVLARLADDRGSFDALWVEIERKVRLVNERRDA